MNRRTRDGQQWDETFHHVWFRGLRHPNQTRVIYIARMNVDGVDRYWVIGKGSHSGTFVASGFKGGLIKRETAVQILEENVQATLEETYLGQKLWERVPSE
jgi:hypothetical protein